MAGKESKTKKYPVKKKKKSLWKTLDKCLRGH